MTLASSASKTSETTDDSSQLQLAYQRLLALERFKSGFLARTSHELRSPINTIVSLHQLILEDLCEDTEEERTFIGQSKEAALKMLALFDQITAVSKLDIGREPPKLEAIDLSFLLPEVEMLTTLQAANQNVRFSVESPMETIEVMSDPKWLKNILVSLIQDTVAHTKLMRLAVEQSDEAITVVIESDRTAQTLQAALNKISEQTPAPSPSRPSPPSPQPPTHTNIQLSTGLLLSTAHIALPIIKGAFKIVSHPDAAERSQLRCEFSKQTL